MPGDSEIPADRLVRVGVDPRWLMLAAAGTYLVPVVAFVAGAVSADQVFDGRDAVALLAGVSFALVAAWFARYPLAFISRPRLALVDMHQGLESASDSDHLSRQGT